MKSWAVLVLLLSLSTLAVADPAKDVATADRLFRIGKYDDAVKLYERAYVEKDDPHLLFQIGECHRLAERPKEAARLYEQFLKTNPKGLERANAQSHLAEARDALQREPAVQPPAAAPPPPTPEPPPSYPPPVYAAAPVWAPPPSDPNLRRMQLTVDIKAARKARNRNSLLGFGSFFLIIGTTTALTGLTFMGDKDLRPAAIGIFLGGALGPLLGGAIMAHYGGRLFRADDYRVKKLENELDVVSGNPPRHENLTPPRPKQPKVEDASRQPSVEPSKPSEANDW